MNGSKKTIGSSDVARLAGVSRSAVSRAFTPGAYISPETRQRVVEAAEMLNYSPNAIARSLSKKSSGLVGIIASNLDNPYYALMLSALSSALQAKGYGILLLIAELDDMDALIPKLLSYQVDGVILPAATLSSKMAVVLERSGRPVVLVNRYLQQDVVSSVSGDNYGGGTAVADLLVKGGHRRIAYMAGLDDTSSSRDRGQGLKDRLATHGIAIYAQEAGQYRHVDAVAAARRLLSMTPAPDAIFCANDIMAMAALEVAKVEYGLKVPAELAIVGYDNSDPASWPLHQLTSVDQHLEDMVKLSVEMLLRKLVSGDTTLEHLTVPASLVVRASTRQTG
ncbi:LacI family DNA-binding transcriptional regulator [Devosia sp.]|uniref:LacI family DNA-binding transcriptional regulator n=1 Tax=Devosia sp. TaxID=1871048 RepID=UPI00261AE1F6|nr:LacI family DNA-binding transcriptional regulator [Devosia sp.]